jgi:hypothetical protein
MVFAFALIARRPIDGSFAQNGYCWRIQAEPAELTAIQTLQELQSTTQRRRLF